VKSTQNSGLRHGNTTPCTQADIATTTVTVKIMNTYAQSVWCEPWQQTILMMIIDLMYWRVLMIGCWKLGVDGVFKKGSEVGSAGI